MEIQYSVVEMKSSKSGMHQSEVAWQQADSANTHNQKGKTPEGKTLKGIMQTETFRNFFFLNLTVERYLTLAVPAVGREEDESPRLRRKTQRLANFLQPFYEVWQFDHR